MPSWTVKTDQISKETAAKCCPSGIFKFMRARKTIPGFKKKLGMVVHNFNSSTEEAEAGGLLLF